MKKTVKIMGLRNPTRSLVSSVFEVLIGRWRPYSRLKTPLTEAFYLQKLLKHGKEKKKIGE